MTIVPINNASQSTVQVHQRPIDLMTSKYPSIEPHGGWYNCSCPAHQDRESSFGFREGEDGNVLFKCFAGCTREHILESLGITEDDVHARNGYKPRHSERKIELMDLAIDKHIHPAFLSSLGIVDGHPWHGSKVIRIPYHTMDGQVYSRARIRTAVTAKAGSKWEGPDTDMLTPYGLDRLQDARTMGFLIFPEGESDCWTLWYHHFPALGIPGASMYDVLQQEHITIFPPKLYLIQEPAEPGKPDAGKAYVEGMAKRLDTLEYQGVVYVVDLKKSHGVKDPNDLHQLLHREDRLKDFKDEFQKALDEATPYIPDNGPAPKKREDVQPLVMDAIEKQDIEALYNLADELAELSDIDQGVLTGSIRDGMKHCNAFSWSAFKKRLTESNKRKEREKREQKAYVTGKPQVLLGRQLHEEIDDTLKALEKANYPPTLFVRGGKLTRYRIDEKSKPVTEMITEDALIERLTRVAEFATYNEQKDSYSSVHPTSRIARSIMAQANTWKFPPLEAITEVPIMRPDGSILDTPGYDPVTCMIYIPMPGLTIPTIPSHPTSKQLGEATSYVRGFIGEFPYVGDADKANAFAPFLTSVTRALFKLVPIGLIDAPKAGTGKGLFTDAISVVASGRTCASITEPSTEEEWTKTLTSLLLTGDTLISIDNIEHLLDSAKLSSFVAREVWKERLLGTNSAPELPQRCIVLANGNNIQLGGDIPRRCYRIRMDSGISQPWTRDTFTHKDLLGDITKDRGKIIAALLTMARAWFVAGCPPPATKIPTIGGFSEWAQIIGGILAHAEIVGFLANNNELYEETDAEGASWTAFLTSWLEVVGGKTVTVKFVVAKLGEDSSFAESLPNKLAVPFLEQSKSFSKKLSNAIIAHNGTPYGPDNLKLIKGLKDSHAKADTWKVAGLAGLAVSDSPQGDSKSIIFSHEEKEKNNTFQIHSGAEGTLLTPLTPQTENTIPPSPVPDGVPACLSSEQIPLLEQVQSHMREKVQRPNAPGTFLWYGQGTGYPNGSVTPDEYCNRVRACYASKDRKRVEAAVIAMERTLGIEE